MKKRASWNAAALLLVALSLPAAAQVGGGQSGGNAGGNANGVASAGPSSAGNIQAVQGVQQQLSAPGPTVTPSSQNATDPSFRGSIVRGKATADVLAMAARAKGAGADRFCMGAAWRNVRDGAEFDAVLGMVRGVRALGMEACVTLGMLSADQADRLKEAGLTAYNHNLDTGPDFYADIISTRTYADRLKTLQAVRAAGLQMCAGGIIGMGEAVRDRAAMLQVLAGFDPHPESVPINALVPVAGTPLANRPKLDPLDLVRMIATARIVMPAARVRLSAGRSSLSREAQVLCMAAGANSLFYGETLLTTPNAEVGEDDALFAALAARSPPDHPSTP